MPDTLDAALLQLVTARLLTEYPNLLAKCFQALSEEDVWWRPHEQANAVGNLVLHVAGSNRYYLEHVVGAGVDVRNREAEFAARGGRSKTDLERVWRDTTARVERVLSTLRPEHLAQITPDRGRSVAQVLLHVTHHNALHIGQIVWVTKMRRPGVF
jgi:uncharacterized damage-inducible protein DinB